MSNKKKHWISLDFEDTERSVKKPKFTQRKKVAPKICKDVEFFKDLEPQKVDDLAVHPKKIKELEMWLQENILKPQRNIPMLLVTGPTGCGKTATINVLCKALEIDIKEWVNPIDNDYENFKGPGQIVRLIEFLIEAKFPSLLGKVETRPKVALIEDFPNALIYNPDEFDNVLSSCRNNGSSAIIFVCTEVNSKNIDIIKKLFTDDIQIKYNIHHISFNATSATLQKQALKRAHELIQKNLDFFKLPKQAVLDAILTTSNGDIRSSIQQYYFSALEGSTDLPTEMINNINENPGQKRKRFVKNSTLKVMAKDETLGLFHSIGRILNPKRIENGKSWKIQCDFNSLIDELSSQPNTFVSFLHENYLRFFGDFEDVFKASQELSFSQIFLQKWNENCEVMIYSLWICILGLMIHNEHRVPKFNPIRGPTKIPAKEEYLNNDQYDATDLYYVNLINNNNSTHKFKYQK